MSFKFLRSWLDVVGLLALLIAFFALLVYAGPTYGQGSTGGYSYSVRTTSYGSSGGYSYGSSGGTATPTQVMSLPKPKAIIQKIRSLLKRGNQQAANASSTTTEIYSIGAVEAPTPLPSFVDSDLDRAVAALEEHNRLDRELTAKADAIERRALALAANQPEPPQYYANSDPPHGRIVPTPGPPKPHPLTPPTVIIMRDGATATPQPAATVKESQCDCGCNCPGCECNKRKAATAKQ